MAETYVDEQGYRRFKDSDILVHRWVAEKKVGGKIYPGYEVHHKRGLGHNDPDSIAVVKKGFHRWIHSK